MLRSLLAAGLVAALPLTALAHQASVLNGRNDAEFAKALVDNGYPDLAERVLVLIEWQTQADKHFVSAEEVMRDRIAELRAIKEPTEVDEASLAGARFNYPRVLYEHSQVFPKGAARRVELCKAALTELDEFILDSESGDSLLAYFANVDYGLCLKEIDRPEEAIRSFDKTIDLRESWGAADGKTGVWPIPASAQDVVDLICYALLQKAIVLREQDKLDDVVKLGHDYFASIAKPFSVPSSMLLAKELGDAQIATGDVKGAVATAASMIHEDPDGLGAKLGRELLGRAAK